VRTPIDLSWWVDKLTIKLSTFCAIIETENTTPFNFREKDTALAKVNYKYEKRQKELDKKKKKDEKLRRKQEKKTVQPAENTEQPKES
jgi:hypothetical protein